MIRATRSLSRSTSRAVITCDDPSECRDKSRLTGQGQGLVDADDESGLFDIAPGIGHSHRDRVGVGRGGRARGDHTRSGIDRDGGGIGCTAPA